MTITRATSPTSRKRQMSYAEQEELVNDMMMLIASFNGRLYSARAKENAKKRKENKNKL